jgi:hypothetical protein
LGIDADCGAPSHDDRCRLRGLAILRVAVLNPAAFAMYRRIDP